MTTTAPQTRLDLDAIEARTAAATRGPWKLKHHEDLRRADAKMVMSPHGCLWHPTLGWVNDVADGEFIAHAREDIPALLARVRELEARLATQ